LIDVEDLGLEAESPLSGSTSAGPIRRPAPDTALLAESTLNLDAITQSLVSTALQKTYGHKGQAAALLGIHPRTLTRMMRRYGIPDHL